MDKYEISDNWTNKIIKVYDIGKPHEPYEAKFITAFEYAVVLLYDEIRIIIPWSQIREIQLKNGENEYV